MGKMQAKRDACPSLRCRHIASGQYRFGGIPRRRNVMVGVRGFEPPTSASRTPRADQTAPHPDRNIRVVLTGTFPAINRYLLYTKFGKG